MQQIIIIFHMVFAIALIALVLVQKGQGAGMGISLGGGASQTVFGSRGAGGFLLKLTCGLAALLFITSLALNYLSNHMSRQQAQISIAKQGAHSPVTKSSTVTGHATATHSLATKTVSTSPHDKQSSQK